MKKITKSLPLLVIAFLFSIGAQAQTWNIPTATTTSGAHFGINDANDLIFKTNNTEYMRLIGVATHRGKLGIGTSTPSHSLEVMTTDSNAYIKVHRTGTQSNPYGTAGYKIGNAASITVTTYPAYGAGTLNISNGTGMINFTGSQVCFGGLPGPGYIAGNYYFNGSSWTKTLAVADASAPGPNPWNIPSGYKFAVQGNSSLNGNVGIGITTFPTNAPSGGYKLALLGNANLNGSVVIGDPASITSGTPFPTGYKLFVTDGILTEKVKVAVKTTSDWSDYVFAPTYKLMPLESVEAYINENKHLPEVPSADEVVNNGIDLGKMDATLLQKIEELTLYMIEMKKEIDVLKKENLLLKNNR